MRPKNCLTLEHVHGIILLQRRHILLKTQPQLDNKLPLGIPAKKATPDIKNRKPQRSRRRPIPQHVHIPILKIHNRIRLPHNTPNPVQNPLLGPRQPLLLDHDHNLTQPLAEKNRTLETRDGMLHAPKERLAARHAVNAQPHGNAQRVRRIQQRRQQVVVALDRRQAQQAGADGGRVARVEAAARPDVEAQPHVRNHEERARGEGDRPAFVVGVEDRFGGLLPERGPGAEGAALEGAECEFGVGCGGAAVERAYLIVWSSVEEMLVGDVAGNESSRTTCMRWRRACRRM
jgi:hypothetical protein